MDVTSQTNSTPKKWDRVIRPQRNWFNFHLRELWKYRDLVLLFVRRDFVAVYKQTILGPLWYLIQPLLTTLTYTFIFGNVARLPTDGLPQFLFYMSGTVIWTYFATCLTKTSTSFLDNQSMFAKVYFPRLVVPISILFSNLVTFLIQFILFLAFIAFFTLRGEVLHPNLLGILLSPILIAMMAGLGFGFGIIVSSLTTKYRDLRFLVTFGVQLLMFATPVIYPVSAIPARFQNLLQFNPLAPLVEAFRFAFLGGGTLDPWRLLYSLGFTLLVLVVGIVIFNRIETTFMDTL